MRYIVSADQMRGAELRAQAALNLPEGALMERAAEGVVSEIINRVGSFGKTAAFACGPGNNGGDGLAAARLFADAGGQSIAILALGGAEPSPLNAENLARAERSSGVYVTTAERLEDMPCPDIWVDALFGVGLNRALGEAFQPLIERMKADRKKGAKVLSVDVPSGIDGDTGSARGMCVEADATVTFEWPKLGHYYQDGLERSGEVVVWPIGVGDYLGGVNAARLIEKSDLRAAYRQRARNSHKGTYGHLLIVAGSLGMAGAALICARAALRSGAGLVSVACPASIMQILQLGAPGAMCVPLEEENGAIADGALGALEAALVGKTALAVGPGLSRRASERVLSALLRANVPAVLDADALNLLAESDDLKALLRADHILTPHPGEAARLLGLLGHTPVDCVEALNQLGAAALLKGSVSTISAGGAPYLSAFGASGMAKGGSGDALTGIIGGLLAQGYTTEDAMRVGCALHGLAGESAARKYSNAAMGVEELIASMGDVFLELEGRGERD